MVAQGRGNTSVWEVLREPYHRVLIEAEWQAEAQRLTEARNGAQSLFLATAIQAGIGDLFTKKGSALRRVEREFWRHLSKPVEVSSNQKALLDEAADMINDLASLEARGARWTTDDA